MPAEANSSPTAQVATQLGSLDARLGLARRGGGPSLLTLHAIAHSIMMAFSLSDSTKVAVPSAVGRLVLARTEGPSQAARSPLACIRQSNAVVETLAAADACTEGAGSFSLHQLDESESDNEFFTFCHCDDHYLSGHLDFDFRNPQISAFHAAPWIYHPSRAGPY